MTKLITILLLQCFIFQAIKAETETDTLSRQVTLETDLFGITRLATWPYATYRFEGRLEVTLIPGINFMAGGGYGGYHIEESNQNLRNHHIRGSYVTGGLVFARENEARSGSFYFHSAYTFSAFRTTGVYVIEHHFWDDYTHPLDARNQKLHGLSFETGYRYRFEWFRLGWGVGVTFPISTENLQYENELSGLRHAYTPGVGIHMYDTVWKTSLRLGWILNNITSGE